MLIEGERKGMTFEKNEDSEKPRVFCVYTSMKQVPEVKCSLSVSFDLLVCIYTYCAGIIQRKEKGRDASKLYTIIQKNSETNRCIHLENKEVCYSGYNNALMGNLLNCCALFLYFL